VSERKGSPLSREEISDRADPGIRPFSKRTYRGSARAEESGDVGIEEERSAEDVR